MLKNLIITLFFLSQIFQIHAQSLVVIDVDNKTPIPFATVMFEDSGVYANQFGEVLFPKKINKNEDIIFSAVGYQEKIIPFVNIKDTVFLKSKIEVLEEVVVYAEKETQKIKELKGTRYFGSFLLKSGTEVISVIVPKEKMMGSYVESISFFFEKPRGYSRYNKEYKDGKAFVFVNVYEVVNDKPHKKTYTTPPLEVKVLKNDQLKIDLTAANLKIERKGLAFGIEYIAIYNNNGDKKDFFIYPKLTDRESEYYSAKTYSKYSLKKKGEIIPYTGPPPGRFSKYYKGERNLIMGFTVFKPKR